MKKYFWLFLLIPAVVWASPPARQYTYTSGETISSSEVTTNEDAIFNYLQGGVDSIKDLTVVNADVHGSANIQSSKLNLTAINQNVANTGTFTNTGNVTVTGDLDFTGDLAVTGTIAFSDLAGSWSNNEASLCVGVDGTIFAKDGGCN